MSEIKRCQNCTHHNSWGRCGINIHAVAEDSIFINPYTRAVDVWDARGKLGECGPSGMLYQPKLSYRISTFLRNLTK